ncbi:MAG TPA: hypothetical protein ENK39_08705 [Epsilonproteobacteria bacterium]|nr:hypothetical protein [Campylobacterota bacterium]
MRILSIGKTIEHERLDIRNINESDLATVQDIQHFSYIIINGGDGTIRRVVKTLHTMQHNAKFILNPIGSFNVIAKLHKVPKLNILLDALVNDTLLKSQKQQYYSLNDEIFLFSAGNMGDLQHVFLSETLRFGILKKGIAKYILAILFLLPVHLIMTPFMLLSKRRFFIFTPASFISQFGSFYGKVKKMQIDLDNSYNHIELDGDVVTIEKPLLNIKPAGYIEIISI